LPFDVNQIPKIFLKQIYTVYSDIIILLKPCFFRILSRAVNLFSLCKMSAFVYHAIWIEKEGVSILKPMNGKKCRSKWNTGSNVIVNGDPK